MGIKERRAQEKEMRRNQILDAARTLLFSQGIHQVSISKISKASQLAVGTIYFYFKNKEEIFIALQQEGLALLYGIVREIVSQPILGEDEKLRQIGRAYADFSREQDAYFAIINSFLSAPRVFFAPVHKNAVDMAGKKILGLIQQVVSQGNDNGIFQESDPAKFALMFWGTLHGLLQFKKLEQTLLGGEDHDQVYAYSVEKIIQSIQSKSNTGE
ncbi:MAG: TetR/AcrR family transcriptional regulator [Desulfobacterales bacterium]|nr:TetR/AcrR family transcriptional regulator [Desulfobacterales bacterium]